ncbi:MAG: NAD(P)H-binding protein [Desulfobacterales bacterium]|nr:NAD(P)H-binding protein [Desulfobacterales bacterium]MCP4160374.1 NAD(P)H-binding protein [Deltaproteobacteria bacterium]
MMKEKHMVTGAFGYSGSYIAKELLSKGYEVLTLTNSSKENDRIKKFPLSFNNKDMLIESLKGVDVLYNTYWVRFNHKNFTYADAVKNTKILFDAAKKANVKKIVHVSITNPSEDSELEYFKGKAELEKELKQSGMEYSIVRPAVFFGGSDILINNIAWSLRYLPVSGYFGKGEYKIRPVHIKDFAMIVVNEGNGHSSRTVNAVGPESYTYKELLKMISKTIGTKKMFMSIPPIIGYITGYFIGLYKRDVFITWDEIKGLMQGLLYTNSEATGSTKLSVWVDNKKENLGRHYESELAKRN